MQLENIAVLVEYKNTLCARYFHDNNDGRNFYAANVLFSKNFFSLSISISLLVPYDVM